MPTAPESERRWARKKFGSIDCGEVEHWLKVQGFTLTPEGAWLRPGKPPSADESRAIGFLIMEWDYDGYHHTKETKL